MERAKYKAIVMMNIFVIVFVFSAFSKHPSEVKSHFYQAYISGNMVKWKNILDQTYALHLKSGNEKYLEEYITGTYGYVPFLIDEKKYDEARKYLEQVQEVMAKLDSDEAQKYTSFKGAFIAFEIGIDMYKAFYLGPKSMSIINESVVQNARNPYGWLEKGNAEYHMPRAFGGSYEEAITHFSKAIILFEETNKTNFNWLYLNTLTWMALSYEKVNDYDNAKIVYQKILAIEPEFHWVKNELFPQFLKNTQTTIKL